MTHQKQQTLMAELVIQIIVRMSLKVTEEKSISYLE